MVLPCEGLRVWGQTKIAYTQDPNLHADGGNRPAAGHAGPPLHSAVLQRHEDGIPAACTASRAQIMSPPGAGLPCGKRTFGVGDRPTEVLLPELTFASLKALLASNGIRAHPAIYPTAEWPGQGRAARQQQYQLAGVP